MLTGGLLMLTAAVYARFSSDLQRATSIDDQLRRCREAASRFGCAVTDAHVFTDAELSASTGHRPGYQALLEAARTRQVDAIIVEAQDRLWRDQAEMHAALKRLQYWGTKVFSLATGTDVANETGMMVATMTGLKDEIFLADLRRKTHRGMEGTVLRGGSAGGRAYGYRSEPVVDEAGRETGRRRVIDPAEAEVVRYICRLFALEGLTPRAIAHRLNAEGVRPPRGAHGRVAGSWSPSTIIGSAPRGIGILSNPLYTGRVVWNRSRKLQNPETGKRATRPRPRAEWTEVMHPELRIVDDELWQQVQARRTERRYSLSGRLSGARPRFLLTGLCVCGECGGSYVAQYHRRGVRHFGCAKHYDRGASVCRNQKLVRQDVLESKVLEHVFGDLLAPHKIEYLAAAVDAILRDAGGQPAAILAARETALRDARRELDHIAHAIRQGIITPTTRMLLEQAEQRVAQLEATVRELRERPAAVVSARTALVRYVEDLRGTLGTNVDAARRLLTRGVGKVVLQPNGAGELWAEMRGSLPGILNLSDEVLAGVGAGRGI